VDDYFGIEREECIAHALHCVARIFRCVMGDDILAPRKMAWGKQLEILGVEVVITWSGISFIPSPCKVCDGGFWFSCYLVCI
jgi:hypothetical protein